IGVAPETRAHSMSFGVSPTTRTFAGSVSGIPQSRARARAIGTSSLRLAASPPNAPHGKYFHRSKYSSLMRAPSMKFPVSSASAVSSRCCNESSSSRMPGITSFTPVPGPLDLLGQVPHVARAKFFEKRRIQGLAVLAHDVVEDAPVGASGELHAPHRIVRRDEILAGAIHRAHPGSSGEDERAIDVEQDEIHYGSEDP